MGYSIEEEDRVKQLFESIANQPIVEQRPYNEVRVAKPIVESTTFFEGTKVDLNKWSTDSKKVGKAKTASNPDLTKGNNNTDEIIKATKASSKQETENDTVTEKKEKGQVTKVVVEDNTAESKTAPKPKSGNFDAAAKSAEKASQSKAESNKKFSEESKNQRRAQILKGFMRSLAVDQKSKDAAEAVCTRIDKHFKIIQKAKTEAANLTETIQWGNELSDILGTKSENPNQQAFFKQLALEIKAIKEQLFGKGVSVKYIPQQYISVFIDHSAENKADGDLVKIWAQLKDGKVGCRSYGCMQKNGYPQVDDFSVPVQKMDENDMKNIILEIAKHRKVG